METPSEDERRRQREQEAEDFRQGLIQLLGDQRFRDLMLEMEATPALRAEAEKDPISFFRRRLTGLDERWEIASVAPYDATLHAMHFWCWWWSRPPRPSQISS